MPVSADCLNTKSVNGQNFSPVELITSVRKVFSDEISLDPASDNIANQYIRAEKFYDYDQDGFNQSWSAKNLWLNPPGKSHTKDGVFIRAADWARKLYSEWLEGWVENAIYLAYRGGSVGSLGCEMLKDSLICQTCSGAPFVNPYGRLSFYILNDKEELIPGVTNTQSSLILLLSNDEKIKSKFKREFRKFGVIFQPC